MLNKRVVVGFVAAAWVAGAWWGPAAADEAKKEFTFAGSKTCKMCHNKEATGAQYDLWMAGPHAKAFEVLASDAAKTEAAKQGIEDAQKAPQCLKCHVTAFPVMDALADLKLTMEEGVSCESCHGAGSAYKSKKVKDGIAAGEIDPAGVGLIAPTKELCMGCHQAEGNAFFKEFKFEEAVKKIAHPIPGSGE